jgi:hypothetical protein
MTFFTVRNSNMYYESRYWVNKMSLRERARLNVGMAKDLAENFGGKKADYLKKLNQKLRTQITHNSAMHTRSFAKAA